MHTNVCFHSLNTGSLVMKVLQNEIKIFLSFVCPLHCDRDTVIFTSLSIILINLRVQYVFLKKSRQVYAIRSTVLAAFLLCSFTTNRLMPLFVVTMETLEALFLKLSIQ